MAKLDFPAASESPWTGSNDVVYTYIGTEPNGYWSAVSPGGGGGGDGDVDTGVMTVNTLEPDDEGDLTLEAADVGATTEAYVDQKILDTITIPLKFVGQYDVTLADPPADAESGNIYEATTTGTVGANWQNIAGLSIVENQLVVLTQGGDWVLGSVFEVQYENATDTVFGTVKLSLMLCRPKKLSLHQLRAQKI